MDINTTIQQMGGRRIFAMAFDAKNTIAYTDALMLKVAPALLRTMSTKVSHVRVTLAADDTYTVETSYTRGLKTAQVGKTEMVYGDQLASVVESMTGLRLSL